MKNQDLAYVLHRRPFKETSFLVDFFTQHHGVITAVCRGGRQNKKRPSLESFNLFWIEYHHANQNHHQSLATLYQYESELADSGTFNLIGNQLYCGFYLNELLIKLLGRHDPYPELFTAYQTTLNQLSCEMLEKTLRHFELFLLEKTGYGIPLEKEYNTHKNIIENKLYYYNPHAGFSAIKEEIQKDTSTSSSVFIFEGKSIINIQKQDLSETKTLKDAKRLIRLTLDFLLERHGNLKSRELFTKY